MKQACATMLAIVNLLSGVTLLALSAWFIAACAIAGHAGVLAGFNYVIPAAVIRFLAIIRLTSGYFEKYIGHLALLDTLASIRYEKLRRAFRSESIKQSQIALTLQQETELMAARWSAVYTPLFASASAMLGLSLMITILLPALLALWCLYLGTVVALLASFFRLSHQAEQSRRHHLQTYLFAQRQWLHTSALWTLTPQKESIITLTEHALRSTEASQKKADLLTRVEVILMILSLIWVALLAHQVASISNQAAVYAIPFMTLLAVRDWLLPAYTAVSQPFDNTWKPEANVQFENTTESTPINETSIEMNLIDFQWQRAQQHGLLMNAQVAGQGIVFFSAPSGLGKSSALLAMVKELPYGGHADLNGINIYERSDLNCRSLLHCAEQFAHVFSGTLRDNLNVVGEKTDQDLISALRWAELSNWANVDSLNQWIGDTGRPISGGEQTRLILARAKLTDAPTLLLDEPFEALDQTLVNKLAGRLNVLAKQKLVIIASHIQPNNLIIEQKISFANDSSISFF